MVWSLAGARASFKHGLPAVCHLGHSKVFWCAGWGGVGDRHLCCLVCSGRHLVGHYKIQEAGLIQQGSYMKHLEIVLRRLVLFSSVVI